MVLAAIDWTMVITSLIVGLPAIISAIYAARVHRQVSTPSDKTIGEMVEYAQDTAIANNMLLSHKNGPTKTATARQLHAEGQTPPQVPLT